MFGLHKNILILIPTLFFIYLILFWQELLTRATEILEEMHRIQLPKISNDNSDPGFLAEFTITIQMFAETLDNIYKQYTNIIYFYLVFEKVSFFLTHCLNNGTPFAFAINPMFQLIQVNIQ